MSPEVDIDNLVEKLQTDDDKAKELSDGLHSEPVPEGLADQLIDDIAENLSTMRDAAGLPARNADHFKQRIRKRQRRSIA